MILAMAQRISDSIGAGGDCARWGGDEFIVLLQDSAPHLLRAATYGLMAAIVDQPIALPDGRSVSVTVSVGACLIMPGDSMDDVIEMADAALYVAKNEGRNRASIMEPDATDGRHAPTTGAL